MILIWSSLKITKKITITLGVFHVSLDLFSWNLRGTSLSMPYPVLQGYEAHHCSLIVPVRRPAMLCLSLHHLTSGSPELALLHRAAFQRRKARRWYLRGMVKAVDHPKKESIYNLHPWISTWTLKNHPTICGFRVDFHWSISLLNSGHSHWIFLDASKLKSPAINLNPGDARTASRAAAAKISVFSRAWGCMCSGGSLWR